MSMTFFHWTFLVPAIRFFPKYSLIVIFLGVSRLPLYKEMNYQTKEESICIFCMARGLKKKFFYVCWKKIKSKWIYKYLVLSMNEFWNVFYCWFLFFIFGDSKQGIRKLFFISRNFRFRDWERKTIFSESLKIEIVIFLYVFIKYKQNERNWVFATKSHFLVPLTLHPDKLNFDISKYIFC